MVYSKFNINLSVAKIGVFDSGYGGLTVLQSLVEKLPQYDFVYLGDNARAPYGDKSFETVYQYTLQAVNWLFDVQNCDLVILACNTASAKALRQIQQVDLPQRKDSKRVLGVIRPTTEIIGNFTKTGQIGVVGTAGTIKSNSYAIEMERFFPGIQVHQEACPIWVHLVENRFVGLPGTDYFVKYHLDHLFGQFPEIDTLLLACTHYPLLMSSIQKNVMENIAVISQGGIVANSLNSYLQRHPEIEQKLSKLGSRLFFTTEKFNDFNQLATLFYGDDVIAERVIL